MFITRFFEPKLAQTSYLIGCPGARAAIVIDPHRDVEPYIAAAAAQGARITHVTETHIHADFCSGARELAARTGATLCLSGEGGPDWQYAFAAADGATLLQHGDQLRIGDLAAIIRGESGRCVGSSVHTDYSDRSARNFHAQTMQSMCRK